MAYHRNTTSAINHIGNNYRGGWPDAQECDTYHSRKAKPWMPEPFHRRACLLRPS